MSFSQKIDLHSHWFSPRVTQLLLDKQKGIRFLRTKDKIWLDRQSNDALPHFFELGPQWFDIQLRIEHLQQHQIQRQLISWPTTLDIDVYISKDESISLSQTYNDDLAELIQQHPNQFSGLAYLSTSNLDHAQFELNRAHKTLGLFGGVLPIGVLSTSASAQQLKDLFHTANALKSHIYLHAGFGHSNIHNQIYLEHSGQISKETHLLNTSYVFASTVFTLLFTDFLDAYPDVTIQIAMLGGAAAFSLLIEQFRTKPERYGEHENYQRRLKQLYFDTGASGDGTIAIETLAKIVGTEQIVFGTDYAPVPSVQPIIQNIENTHLTLEQKQQIYFHNANHLFKDKGLSNHLKIA
ncbi:hypothetical protein B9T31_02905 [Acinetobacter sp. ANC 4558]|uniref:amidohydrolase family protein n=1 Tax=Acinetobacter sp. ANC 4558 TaxID=1977876 RepID=UPI000A349E1D|nr:amidohydrolase family protein [Acinetobacter sp. ANC 4558]OTG87469.1 hypothetical protein B9T31_02905 [Acinetobacter sp. ANC 4558]